MFGQGYGARQKRAANVSEAVRAQMLQHWLQSLWGEIDDVFVKI
jgi:hypothetical protein